MLQELPLHPEGINLADTQSLIEEFTSQPTSIEHMLKLSERLITLHPSESETLLRLMAGKLGGEVDRALVEEAIASCFEINPKAIRASLRAHDSLGSLAVHAKQHGADGFKKSEAAEPGEEGDQQLKL